MGRRSCRFLVCYYDSQFVKINGVGSAFVVSNDTPGILHFFTPVDVVKNKKGFLACANLLKLIEILDGWVFSVVAVYEENIKFPFLPFC